MGRFRKKPVVIDAFQMTIEQRTDTSGWPDWLDEARVQGRLFVWDGTGRLAIRTLEGTMIVDFNDWIICGVKGELYPCKPDIFDATYEPEVA